MFYALNPSLIPTSLSFISFRTLKKLFLRTGLDYLLIDPVFVVSIILCESSEKIFLVLASTLIIQRC
jgi:hypothetical protein